MPYIPCRLRPLALWVVGALFGLGELSPAPCAAEKPFRVISSTESRLIFEVDATAFVLQPSRFVEGAERLEIPGFGTFSNEGEPRIPARSFLVALPPDGGYSLRYTIERVQSLGTHRLEPVPFAVPFRDGDFVSTSEEFRIDPAVYNETRAVAGVSDAGVGMVRHQRVLSIDVSPVSYDPTTGETAVATLIRIEVSFSGGAQGQGSHKASCGGRCKSWESGNASSAIYWSIRRRVERGVSKRRVLCSRHRAWRRCWPVRSSSFTCARPVSTR